MARQSVKQNIETHDTKATEQITVYSTDLAKVAVQSSADTFVVNQTFVLRINICGVNRHLRQARNRYRQPLRTIVTRTFEILKEQTAL